MVKFSIILPIYNVETFLTDCLDSLYFQDIQDNEYEIICVIDGSPDHSKDIVRMYQIKHDNIKLIVQPNSGVCAARNRGFLEATGKYIWFIDPDDMIATNCLGKIYDLMERNKADIFELNFATCNEDTKFIKQNINFEIDGENREGSHGSGCLSICLSSYLKKNKIQWNPQLHYGEDYLWAFQTKFRRHKSIYTNSKLYFYRQRNNSAMHIVSKDKTEKHLQDMLLLYNIYGDEYERCKSEALPKTMLTNINHRRQLCLETALCHLIKLKLSNVELKKRLKQLKQKGYYPYKLMWWNLGFHSELGPWKKRLLKFLFPFELYYIVIYTLYR